MKKFMTWMLLIMLSLSMTACSKGDGKKEAAKQPTAADSSVRKTENSQKEPSKEERADQKKKQKKKEKKTTQKKKETAKNTSKKFSKNSEQKKETSTTERKKTKTTETSREKKEKFCQISINCHTVLKNKEKLKSNYQIPSGGEIYSGRMKIEDGDTVMTVLRKTGVNIDTSKGYVQGIDGLYEFDCGHNSGWMYKVNGKFPNVGAGKYTVQDGDTIQWLYTCERGDI